MVTNQIMKRQLSNFSILQRTKDGYFNATELLKQWNNPENLNTQENGEYKKKDIDNYLNLKSTQEFLKALCEEENINGDNSPYLASRGKNGGTWMHPLLFIDFAMWLNPSFKVKVLKFISDQMLAYRNEAGEAYKALSSAVAKIVSANNMKQQMLQIARAINWVVFGNHQKEIQNNYGEEQKQKELFEMERQIAMLINDGFLKGKDEVIVYLRKSIWISTFRIA